MSLIKSTASTKHQKESNAPLSALQLEDIKSNLLEQIKPQQLLTHL